jgi:hypothetical protein
LSRPIIESQPVHSRIDTFVLTSPVLSDTDFERPLGNSEDPTKRKLESERNTGCRPATGLDRHPRGKFGYRREADLRATQIEPSLPALSIGLARLSEFNEGQMMTHGEALAFDTNQPPLTENDLGTNGRRVDSACRYFIAFLMLLYGLVKVVQGQFYIDEYWRDTSLRNLDGMQLVWSF